MRSAAPSPTGCAGCDAPSVMAIDASLLLVVAAVFGMAGVVKGVIGFGLPTIAMGLLGALIAPDQAAAILVLPTLLTNIWQMWRGPNLRALVRRLWPMMVAIVLGTVLAAGIITGDDPRLTTTLIGAMLVIYALFGFSGWKFLVPQNTEIWAGPAAGLVTGVISGATAIFVLPSMPYLQAINLDRDELIQAFGLSAFVSSVGLALGLGLHQRLDTSIAMPVLVALAMAFAGMALGQRLRSKLSVAAFQRWVFGGLIALGLAMIVRAQI